MQFGLLRAGVVMLFALIVSASVQAHEVHLPIGKCWTEAKSIICEGGESDGDPLLNALVEVISYDEKTLFSGKLNDHSRIRFARPAGQFYILIDAGPGQVIELDWKDIKGI
jgi:hypothetical protein